MQRNRGYWVLVAAILGLWGCGDERAKIPVPKLGTEFVVFGAAGGGRALADTDLEILRSDDVFTVEVPGSGNSDVELLFAGVRQEDLPEGLTPDAIKFVSLLEENSRPLMPMFAPHLLLEPVPGGFEGTLVPVEEATTTEQDRQSRRDRLAQLTSRVGIADPCVSGKFTFTTPRIPATGVRAARYQSDGGAVLGLTATGTAMLGRWAPAASNLNTIGISAGEEPLVQGESLAVIALGSREAPDPMGRMMPENIAMIRGGAVAVIGRYDPSRRAYVDETPRTLDTQPFAIEAFNEVEVDGLPQLCMIGTVLPTGPLGSGALAAGVWCRAPEGGAWTAHNPILGARSLRLMIERRPAPLLAVDRAGTVHEHAGNGKWTKIGTPEVNRGCDPLPCKAMELILPLRPPAAGLALIASSAHIAYVIREQGNSVAYDPTAVLTKALFLDERGELEQVPITAGASTPDGAVWLALGKRLILRVSPNFTSAERVCLPSSVGDHPVTSIAAATSGELLVSTSPPMIGVATWQRP